MKRAAIFIAVSAIAVIILPGCRTFMPATEQSRASAVVESAQLMADTVAKAEALCLAEQKSGRRLSVEVPKNTNLVRIECTAQSTADAAATCNRVVRNIAEAMQGKVKIVELAEEAGQSDN